MAKASKNSRSKIKTDIFNHKGCDGILHMRSIVRNGKMKHYAECQKCGKTARRMKDLI